MEWKILRARRLGVRLSDFVVAEERGAVLGRPLPLALGQEVERRREHVGVERRLDLEDLRRRGRACTLPMRQYALVQLALVLVHEAAACAASSRGLWWWRRLR